MDYEHQLSEMATKNLETLDSFRLRYDKLCIENQEKRTAMNKFLIALQRLKSDLHFLYISKNLKMLDLAEKNNNATNQVPEADEQLKINQEDLISIKFFISMLRLYYS